MHANHQRPGVRPAYGATRQGPVRKGAVMSDPLRPLWVAAEQLGVSRRAMYRLLDEGELRSCKIGTRRLVPQSSIDEFVQRRLAAATSEQAGGGAA